MHRGITAALAAFALATLSTAVNAASVTFLTPVGATTSGPVSAEADFVTGAGTVMLTLKNLTVNPTDVAQNLSAITFTLSSGTTGTLASSSGQERSVNSDKTYTDGATVAAGWVLSGSGTLTLDVLSGPGHAGPEHTLLGKPAADNKYDSANGSIKNNGPHNPFLNQSATFNLNVLGVTADTTITSVTFQFGTTDGANLITPPPKTHIVPVPLPAAAWMGMGTLGAMGLVSKVRRRRVG